VRLINYVEQRHRNDIDEKYHQLNLGNIGRVMYWQRFFDMIKNVEGDIVECGVGRGRSLLILAAINSLLGVSEGGQRHISGYDSFEGFPEPTVEDSSSRNPQKGEWSTSPSGHYTYSEDFTNLVLESADVSTERVSLTKGFFQNLLRCTRTGRLHSFTLMETYTNHTLRHCSISMPGLLRAASLFLMISLKRMTKRPSPFLAHVRQ